MRSGGGASVRVPGPVLNLKIYRAYRSNNDERNVMAGSKNSGVIRADLETELSRPLTFRVEMVVPTLFAVSPFFAMRSAPTAAI